MKIGWLISTNGIFGSVREVIENSNWLVKYGHEVTLYAPAANSVTWIEYLGKTKHCHKCIDDDLDFLIMVAVPDELMYTEFFKAAKAKIKIYCFMGVDDNNKDFNKSRFLKEIVTHHYLIADSNKQLELLRKENFKVLDISVGGINLNMFKYKPDIKRDCLIWAGDMRPRKGSETVINALEGFNKLPIKTYFAKGIKQTDMSDFLNTGLIYVDGHIRGGWCNPVLEAMACGCIVVCTDIMCNSEFAFNKETTYKVQCGNDILMKEYIEYLISNEEERNRIRTNALEVVKQFDYKIISKKVEIELLKLL
jgi:hypothetical protein